MEDKALGMLEPFRIRYGNDKALEVLEQFQSCQELALLCVKDFGIDLSRCEWINYIDDPWSLYLEIDGQKIFNVKVEWEDGAVFCALLNLGFREKMLGLVGDQ